MIRFIFTGAVFTIAWAAASVQPANSAGSGISKPEMPVQTECEAEISEGYEHLYLCETRSGVLYLLFNYSGFPDVQVLLAPLQETGLKFSLHSSETTPIPVMISEWQPQDEPVFQNSVLFDRFIEQTEAAAVFTESDLSAENDTTLTKLEIETESPETVRTDSLQQQSSTVTLLIGYTTDTTYPSDSGRYTLSTDEIHLSFSVNYPQELLSSRFLNDVLESARNDLNQENYTSAFHSLENGFAILPSDKFITEARGVMEEWGKGVSESREQTDALTETLQQSFLFQHDEGWAGGFRMELLHRYLLFAEEQMASPEYLLEGYRHLILWSDGEVAYRFKALQLQSEISYKMGNYWESIDFLQEAEGLQPDLFDASEWILDRLMKGFEFDHENNQYSSIYFYGEKYHHLFDADSKARYIYSRAAKDQRKAETWAAELEWLLGNALSVQELISRRELQGELNFAYQMSMQFMKALELNRRVFLEENEEKELHQFIIHLRAKMLKPMFQVLTAYISTNHVVNSGLSERIHFYSNNYLNAIYLQNALDGGTELVYSSDKSYDPGVMEFTDVITGGTFFADDELEQAWFVYPYEGFYLIIVMDTGLSAADLNKIDLILNTPDLPNAWQPLVRTNEVQGAVASATVLSALFEEEPLSGNTRFFDTAHQRLTSNESLQYMLVRDISGESGFVFKEAGEEVSGSVNWTGSFQKELLYHQVLLAGEDEILDVTHSLMREGVTTGHLKIGYSLIK